MADVSPANRSLAKARMRAAWPEVKLAWDDARRERSTELGQLALLISDEIDSEGVPLVAFLALDDVKAMLVDPANRRALDAANAGALPIVVLLGEITLVGSIPYDDFTRHKLSNTDGTC